MARQRIAQKWLTVGGLEPRSGTALDEMAALVDWAEINGLLAGIATLDKP